VISKRIYTLSFNRDDGGLTSAQELLEKLQHARDERAVVVTTPEAVKSVMLTYLDVLNTMEAKSRQAEPDDKPKQGAKKRYPYEEGDIVTVISGPFAGTQVQLLAIEDHAVHGVSLSSGLFFWIDHADLMNKKAQCANASGDGNGNESNELAATAGILAQALRMFGSAQGGIGLIDEVDLVLHPLKSELNYPIFHKLALDLDKRRWELAFFLLDGVIFHPVLHRITVEGFALVSVGLF
jgi:hypothetical protein